MKSACEKWKDRLLGAALTGACSPELAEHLQTCARCSAEMRDLEARRARMDALLPLLAQGAQPSADFRVRVLATAEATEQGKRARRWRAWTLAGATVVVAAGVTIATTLHWNRTRVVQEEELAAAERLAEWRAPSDGLLATPGQEMLRTMPRLGESYLNVPVKTEEEE